MTKQYHRNRARTGVGLAFLGAASAFSLAPMGTATAQEGDADEIVVTANRSGEQSLQDIPMAVSAIDPQDMSRRGVESLRDIVRVVPSIHVTEQGPGQTKIDIRGLSTGTFSFTETSDRPLVAIYLDDAPISIQGANPEIRVFDLERIEVLRGPQGTLYGSGSMAGTIRYITRKPDANRMWGNVEAVASTTEEAGDLGYSLRGSVNAPLDENLALLVSAYWGEDAGFIDNIGTGEVDANSAQTMQARLAARWNVTPNLMIDASALFSNLETQGRPAAFTGLGEYTYESLTEEGWSDDFRLYNLTGDYDFGDVRLVSSTSFIDRAYELDISGSAFEYLNDALFRFVLGYAGPRLPGPGNIDQEVQTFTQEVRLLSAGEGPLSWSLGAFYENTSRDFEQLNPVPGLDALVTGFASTDYFAPATDTIYFGTQAIEERQWAIFGEATYAFTPRLRGTIGLRYFDFEQTFDLRFTGLVGAFLPNFPTPTGAQPLVQSGNPTESGVNPRFVLSYDVSDDVMIFAEASRGFRYGAVNEPVPDGYCGADLAAIGIAQAPTSFGPDSLWNYSVGQRGVYADGRVTFNTTAFHIVWSDVQARNNLPCGYYFRENEGEVTSTGVEIESRFRLTDSLTVGFNASFTEAQASQDIPGGPSSFIALEGDAAPFFPRWIAALTSEYSVPVGAAAMTFTADLFYRDETPTRFRSDNPTYRVIPEQTILNASAIYDAGDWEIGVFGTNLTNDEALSLIEVSGGFGAPGDTWYYGRPRTIGVRTRLSF